MKFAWSVLCSLKRKRVLWKRTLSYVSFVSFLLQFPLICVHRHIIYFTIHLFNGESSILNEQHVIVFVSFSHTGEREIE